MKVLEFWIGHICDFSLRTAFEKYLHRKILQSRKCIMSRLEYLSRIKDSLKR